MSPVIAAHDLRKHYVMGDEIVHALDGVSFSVEKGEYAAIVGPSGSGKSTLMNLIGGLDTPTSGSLIMDGVDVSTLDDSALAGFRNRMIGFVFQSFNLLPRLTALENVEVPLVYAGKNPRDRRERAAALLERVGLGARLGHKPTQLSGGQQQRVAIARALSCSPSLLLADEPTGALDTQTGRDILALFQALNDEGVSVIIVTHDLEVAAATRRVLEMRDGRLVSDRKLDAAS